MKLRIVTTLLLVFALAGLIAAGCGGKQEESGGGAPAKVDVAKGRKLFQTGCKSCHTLADADARGSFGPNLDDLPLDYERVREQIDTGGGGMSPDIYEGEDADTVAAYVVKVAGK